MTTIDSTTSSCRDPVTLYASSWRSPGGFGEDWREVGRS